MGKSVIFPTILNLRCNVGEKTEYSMLGIILTQNPNNSVRLLNTMSELKVWSLVTVDAGSACVCDEPKLYQKQFQFN